MVEITADNAIPLVNMTREAQKDSEALIGANFDKKGSSPRLLKCVTLLVLLLGLAQYVYGIFDHSSLMKMQFATSALIFISSIEHIVQKNGKDVSSDTHTVFLLFRTAGLVFFIACLFLNMTHCMEELTDVKATEWDWDWSGLMFWKQWGVDPNATMVPTLPPIPTTTVPPVVENATHEHHQSGVETVYISVADVVIKTIFINLFNALSLNIIVTAIAVVCPPILTLFVFFYNYFEPQIFNEWVDHHLEPTVAIVLSLISIGIAFFSLMRKKQYLLAEGPKNFEINKISESVKAKNQNLEKIDHVHASCQWPEGFTVSLKAYIKVEKSNKNWVSRAANDFAQLKALLHQEIKAEGAKEVIVEPVFVDRNENPDFEDPVCISASCHNEDVGCCTNPKPPVAQPSPPTV